MTPIQYLVSQLVPVIAQNNPTVTDVSEITAYATSLATMYLTYILPNLSVNLTTGAIIFVVPTP